MDPKLREVGILVNGRQERDSRNKGANVFCASAGRVRYLSICRVHIKEQKGHWLYCTDRLRRDLIERDIA